MLVSKNDYIKVKIIDLSKDGVGISKYNDLVVFVKGAIIGDLVEAKIIKVKKNYFIGRLEKIIEQSPYRIASLCPVSFSCGGCVMQEVGYENQLVIKQGIVEQTMKRIGSITHSVNKVVGSEKFLKYRNKVQLPVREINGEIKIGYYRKGTHDIVETDYCNVEHDNNKIVKNILKEFMLENSVSAYNERTHRGVVRHLLTRMVKDGELSVTVVVNAKKLKKSDILIAKLSEFDFVKSISININMEKTNRILGSETINLYGEKNVEDDFAHLKFKISPNSFYQINKPQAVAVYEKVASYLEDKKENVLDLYCGIGTISLFVANKAKEVIGVEIVEQAVEDAKENAKLNGVLNVSFICGKSEEKIVDIVDKDKIDVIIVDPPRKGLHENVIEQIFEIKPKKVIYVSCDVATLARDLKLLKEEYEIREITPYDFFPMTMHIENVVFMSRK